MGNGYNSDVSADSILWARGAGFGGYNYGGQGSFAGLSSNAVRINAGNRATAAGIENLLDQNQFSSTNKNITDCCNRALDQSTNGEFRNGDRLRDVEKLIVDAEKAAAICCCETQKEILRLDANNNLKFADLSKQQAVDHGVTTAKLATIEAKIDANKEIGELRAQLQTQQIFATCGCGCGGGVTPCPPTAG